MCLVLEGLLPIGQLRVDQPVPPLGRDRHLEKSLMEHGRLLLIAENALGDKGCENVSHHLHSETALHLMPLRQTTSDELARDAGIVGEDERQRTRREDLVVGPAAAFYHVFRGAILRPVIIRAHNDDPALEFLQNDRSPRLAERRAEPRFVPPSQEFLGACASHLVMVVPSDQHQDRFTHQDSLDGWQDSDLTHHLVLQRNLVSLRQPPRETNSFLFREAPISQGPPVHHPHEKNVESRDDINQNKKQKEQDQNEGTHGLPFSPLGVYFERLVSQIKKQSL